MSAARRPSGAAAAPPARGRKAPEPGLAASLPAWTMASPRRSTVSGQPVIVRGVDGALVAHYLIAVFCGRWLAGEPMPGSDEIAARFVPVTDIDDADRYRLTDGAAAFIHRAWAQLQTSGA